MPRLPLLLVLAALAVACSDEASNPFDRLSPSRAPAEDAALLFLSGSWSAQTGGPRELFSATADGSKVEQLTTCARAAQPCDFLQVSPSPDRRRIVAVRTTPGAEEGATVLYFMDLSRSAETIIFPRRRVLSADWSSDASFLVFTAGNPQGGNEDMFYSEPDGQDEQNLTQSVDVRERNARIDPFRRTAAFERIDESGVSRIYALPQAAITSGPATGPALPDTPYLVGADADPAFSPDALSLVFRRLTGIENGGLGSWDILVTATSGTATARTIASGPLYRGAPDWGPAGIVFVETDAATSVSQLVVVQPDGSGRTVLRTEDAGYRMSGPRWLY